MDKPKLVKLVQTCFACPSQWEGKLDDGRMIYIRYRWGVLSISVSPEPTDDIMDAVGGEEIFGTIMGDGFDGYLEEAKLMPILKNFFEIDLQ